ncbi:MAG: hypothetical protein V8T62_00185 [Oscillospiraceae bacterium]
MSFRVRITTCYASAVPSCSTSATGTTLDSDPRQPRSPKPDSPPSRSPYHPDGFIPDRPGRGPVFHPDAVAAKEERYIPPAPPQKPPFRRRSFWGGENPKKK